MTLLSLLEQLYAMPKRMSYSQFIKVRQDIRNRPDFYTIKDEFEQSYTEESGWLMVGADFNSLILATLQGDLYRKPFEFGETLTA